MEAVLYLCWDHRHHHEAAMKLFRRSRKGLPSPFEVLFYLLAVVAFCVINWRLLNADNTPPPEPPARDFESMVMEAMLDDLEPVSIPGNRTAVTGEPGLGSSDEHGLVLENWMISPVAFSPAERDGEPVLQEWMIDLSSWGVK